MMLFVKVKKRNIKSGKSAHTYASGQSAFQFHCEISLQICCTGPKALKIKNGQMKVNIYINMNKTLQLANYMDFQTEKSPNE